VTATVRIPTILRTYTGGASEVSAEGATLADVLNDLEANYTGIRARILDDAGDLRRFVNVYVQGEDIRFLDGLETSVEDGDEVTILPAVAGGG
jgi:MoaD family protein